MGYQIKSEELQFQFQVIFPAPWNLFFYLFNWDLPRLPCVISFFIRLWWNKMYYTYVLRSVKDSNLYIGFTENLEKRIKEHNSGKVKSTRYRTPFELVYFEACRNIDDALHREKYLKTTYGHRYLQNRLKNDR
jgi:putative endonuclease